MAGKPPFFFRQAQLARRAARLVRHAHIEPYFCPHSSSSPRRRERTSGASYNSTRAGASTAADNGAGRRTARCTDTDVPRPTSSTVAISSGFLVGGRSNERYCGLSQ